MTPIRLRGSPYKTVLAAHTLAAGAWFGLAVAIVAAVITAAAVPDPRSLYQLLAAAPSLTISLGLVVVATGVVLGLGTAWGLARYWWVLTTVAIAAIVLVSDALVVGRAAAAAARTAQADARLYVSTSIHVLALGAAMVLSVLKPRRRIRRPHPTGLGGTLPVTARHTRQRVRI